MGISQFMTDEHRACDDHFAAAEQAAANGDWQTAEKEFLTFSNDTLTHFKREEDGVVLVDLDRCQGYRYCIAGCPYKKIYFNPKISKSEKCILCFPRVEKVWVAHGYSFGKCWGDYN